MFLEESVWVTDKIEQWILGPKFQKYQKGQNTWNTTTKTSDVSPEDPELKKVVHVSQIVV